ncbi:MAG: class I mannose-6-phosphate isomerase [Anaerorhabdus sp.]
MNYEQFPATLIKNAKCYVGYDKIICEINSSIDKEQFLIALEMYPGVNEKEVLENLCVFEGAKIFSTLEFFKNEKELNEMLKYNLTDDRVFGKMFHGNIFDFIDNEKFVKMRKEIENEKGLKIIYGFGASLISCDLNVYFDLSRWEIQQRYRSGMPNFNCSNDDSPILSKFKRGYFIEWRVADKHKVSVMPRIDYFVDTNKENNPKMITKKTLDHAMNLISTKPFRTVPYFDPGVWGGQWMKEVCGLDKNKENFAWSFDGVPEENSLLLDIDNHIFEFPAMTLVLMRPKQLLGEKVFARFGAEFPIRFDFLDTMEGQNLSLQVHPLTEYIKKEFGMTYTQDESYYILDAKEDATVYLGVKENTDSRKMMKELRSANDGERSFDVDQYINKFPAKKHDHFLIPAGTCHCSGRNAMVLEISATPYIFTFKLWDWGRLGLDGLPRPVHIDHGERVIQWDRTTTWVENNLINDIETIEENSDFIEEHTGLHELEFIETRRYWINKVLKGESNGNVSMWNLVEGKEAIIESTANEFDPFIVHYAETFIIPASSGKFTIKPHGESNGKMIGVIKAYVRGC